MWSFVRYWLPVLGWMGLIFGGSADPSSTRHSSRIIGPLVRWLFPDLSLEAVETVVLCVRKCGHLGEYAVLAMLLWRALDRPSRNDPRPRQWSKAGLAVVLAALYAASDEFHQTFVPTRQGSVWDVLLDSCGAIFGLVVLYGIGALRLRRQGRRGPGGNRRGAAERRIAGH